jgi:hypothetical protein
VASLANGHGCGWEFKAESRFLLDALWILQFVLFSRHVVAQAVWSHATPTVAVGAI